MVRLYKETFRALFLIGKFSSEISIQQNLHRIDIRYQVKYQVCVVVFNENAGLMKAHLPENHLYVCAIFCKKKLRVLQ